MGVGGLEEGLGSTSSQLCCKNSLSTMSAALGTDAARLMRTPKDQAIETIVNQSAGVSRERQWGPNHLPSSFTLTLPRRTAGERERKGPLEKKGRTLTDGIFPERLS